MVWVQCGLTQGARTTNSDLRAGGNDMVRGAAATRKPAERERDDRGARGGGPAGIRADVHRGIPVVDGGDGRWKSPRKTVQELRARPHCQLRPLALRPARQFQIRALASPRPRRQSCQYWLELLP